MSDRLLPFLDTFVLAANLASFSAAAKILKVSQAAVSQRIGALEEEAGTSLFLREGGRVALTEAGKILHRYAQQIIELHDRARAEVATMPAVQGELALAASSIPADHLLPEILARFGREHPEIKVQAAVADSQAVLAQVEEGKVHLGLVGMKDDNPIFVFEPFASDHLVVLIPMEHPWRNKERIKLKTLLTEPLILREPGSGSRRCFEAALQRAGHSLDEFEVALQMGSNQGIKESVLRGMGIALLSNLVVEQEPTPSLLRTLDVADLDLTRTFYIVHDRRRPLSAHAELFRQFLLAGRDPG